MTKAVFRSGASRRLARAARTRRVQARLRVSRLMVHMSERHAYAQILSPQARVLACASTAEKEMRQLFSNGGNATAAAAVGKRLAEKVSAAAGVTEQMGKLAFDRGGRKYAGRVRALAEAARAGGLKF